MYYTIFLYTVLFIYVHICIMCVYTIYVHVYYTISYIYIYIGSYIIKSAKNYSQALPDSDSRKSRQIQHEDNFCKAMQQIVDDAEHQSYFEHMSEYIDRICQLAYIHQVSKGLTWRSMYVYYMVVCVILFTTSTLYTIYIYYIPYTICILYTLYTLFSNLLNSIGQIRRRTFPCIHGIESVWRNFLKF